jgi:hypothetical protein
MNDRDRPPVHPPRNVYEQLRQRNERRMQLARMSEARRRSQIERVIELSREPRFRGREK